MNMNNPPRAALWAIAAGLAVLTALVVVPAHAEQTVISGSTAVSGSSSAVKSNTSSVASNAGNSQTTNFTSPSDVTVTNAPALGSLALGGGHPCAFSPVTGQFSILGGGAGLGGMTVDSACMLMVMGYSDPRAKQAAEYMIAARDPDACTAMMAYGMVADCVKRGGASAVQQPAAAASGMDGVRCERDAAGNVVKIVIRKGVDPDAARLACGA